MLRQKLDCIALRLNAQLLVVVQECREVRFLVRLRSWGTKGIF
jgi:hypothetical protein